MLKKFMAALLAVCLLLTTLPTAMLAGEGEGDGNGGETPAPITMTVDSISVNPTVVIQEQTGTQLTINFSLETTEVGQSFKIGDKASVDTNIGDLFNANWNESFKDITVTDSSQKVIGTISVTETEVTFTVGEGLVEQNMYDGGQVTFLSGLTAKNVGATAENPTDKNLEIGGAKASIEFQQPATPEGASGGWVDLDTYWKNGGPKEGHSFIIPAKESPTGKQITAGDEASMYIEVNPIGSMHLYGSTTYPDRKPTVYQQMFVKDEIPSAGVIDEDSVYISAAVPALAEYDGIVEDDSRCPLEEGDWYAKRAGTMRYQIANNSENASTSDRLKKLEQTEEETIDQFEDRVRAELSWGIYYDENTNTQTFMCNFGCVGDPDPKKNNGIYYEDFDGLSSTYVKKYPQIFSNERGITGGNIVSYYIEFDTYYPEIERLQSVQNTMYMSQASNPEQYQGARSATYYITPLHGGSTGVPKKNQVIVKVVDEDNKSLPIEGATFIVQERDENGEWKNTNAIGTTDKYGRIVFDYFPQGTYRLHQTATADGYQFSNDTFGSGNIPIANNVSTDGTFTVTGDEEFGFSTIVTNKKIDDPVKVTFDQNYETDPRTWAEVSLEENQSISELGNAWPTNPSRDGYTFQGWNTAANGSGATFEATTLVSKDITVYAQWQPVEVVTLAPADQTIYTGGVDGSDENDEFPHPIYLLGGEALDENTTFCVNGTVWNNETYEYPFTVKYYDGDKEITDDQRYGDYAARIVPVGNFKLSDITTADGKGIDFKEGTLRIRYVSNFTEASANALTSDAVLYADESEEATARAQVEASGEAGVILPASSQIYLNGNKSYVYSADGPGQIALLFDELLPASAGGDSTDLVDDLIARAAAEGYHIQDSNTMFRYLDLVDTKDSNAWVSSSEGSDVFWPYPEGCDRNDDIQLLHFTDLHREYRMTGEAPLAEQIAASDVENVSIEKTANGIWFHVAESGFSPFALVWDEKNDHPHWPPVGPGDDDDDPSEDPEEPDTPALDKVNHFLYVEGYPEDYRTGEYSDNEDLWPVKPQGNITRAEVATIFYRLLKDEVREEIETDVSSFPDVNKDDWFNVTVSSLANMGAISGYEDGTFRPNEPISRAELAAMAVRFYDTFEAEYEEGTFLDVDGDEWYADAIAAAEELGIIGGYPDGTVRPEANITRAETCAIVNRVLERRPHDDHLGDVEDMRTWPDNQPGAWYYADMQEATNGHYYEWIDIDGSKFEEWTEVDKDYDWTKR